MFSELQQVHGTFAFACFSLPEIAPFLTLKGVKQEVVDGAYRGFILITAVELIISGGDFLLRAQFDTKMLLSDEPVFLLNLSSVRSIKPNLQEIKALVTSI